MAEPELTLDDTHKRIAGIYVENDDLAAVWLSLNPDTGRVTIYDCCYWREVEPFSVLADSLNARGRYIPVAWNNVALAKKLLEDRGCNMLPDRTIDDGPMAEVSARDMQSKMRSRLLAVRRDCKEWQIEFDRFIKQNSKVPTSGFPLMSATRYAIENLKYARSQLAFQPRSRDTRKPRTAIV